MPPSLQTPRSDTRALRNVTPPSPSLSLSPSSVDAVSPAEGAPFAGPPTPPTTADGKGSAQARIVIEYLRDLQYGRRRASESGRACNRFELAAGEYEEVLRRLERDVELRGFVEDKVRYDYHGQGGRLEIRMVSAAHESFRAGLKNEIVAWLNEVEQKEGTRDDMKEFVKEVRKDTGSPTYEFPPGKKLVTYTPDIVFRHRRDALPSVIIEVAYSRSGKALRRLAYNYLMESNTSVQVVVGIDIKQRSSRKATFSVWRIKVDDSTKELILDTQVHDREFRGEDGKPMDHSPLTLALRDFATKRTADQMLTGDACEDVHFSIPMARLCALLSTAEKDQADTDEAKTGGASLAMDELPKGFRKRPLSESPPPQLGAEAEAAIRKDEERAAERVNRGDRAYSARVSKELPQRESHSRDAKKRAPAPSG